VTYKRRKPSTASCPMRATTDPGAQGRILGIEGWAVSLIRKALIDTAVPEVVERASGVRRPCSARAIDRRTPHSCRGFSIATRAQKAHTSGETPRACEDMAF
jgi:hypothetical protein